ncbi:MAG: NAD(P)/FAD-dependent oxidoreductase [Deltaproteobacteria bacterium]|nr:NAD(P)/FAD-dependent oxidoreductase [Deltaproteobacteria bacterium]
MLIATGRKPNTDGIGLEKAGIKLDSRGFVKVNEVLETSVPGIYGAGDVIGEPMFVYTAAYEGALAAENAVLGSSKPRDYSVLPWLIFTDPQVAGVGIDEGQALPALAPGCGQMSRER